MSYFEELEELKRKATVRQFSYAAQLKDGSWLMGSYGGSWWIWLEPDMETVRLEITHDDLMVARKTRVQKKFEHLLREAGE